MIYMFPLFFLIFSFYHTIIYLEYGYIIVIMLSLIGLILSFLLSRYMIKILNNRFILSVEIKKESFVLIYKKREITIPY